MTAIVLGYTAPGRTAEPTVLYAGTDAGAASDISLAPPAGIIRTEFIKNPLITRRRFFPEQEAPAVEAPEEEAPAVEEPEEEAPPAKPAKGK